MKIKKSIVLGFFFVLICLGFGYAFLTTTLTINGVTDIDSNTWDIYWNNVQVTTGSVSGTQVTQAPTISNDKTNVSFQVRLSKPGDFYEFTVDAKNDGTIDSMIDVQNKYMNDVVIETLPDYLNYTVTYSDNSPIMENHLLGANQTVTYKIRVEYRQDIWPDQLPSTQEGYTFGYEVSYVQADSTARPKGLPVTVEGIGTLGYDSNTTWAEWITSPYNIWRFEYYEELGIANDITYYNCTGHLLTAYSYIYDTVNNRAALPTDLIRSSGYIYRGGGSSC